MASSFLTPPNSYSLSDRVIGGVVQRVGSRLGLSDENETREVSRYTKPRETFAFGDADSSPMDKLPPRTTVGRKLLPDLDSLAHVATNRSTSLVPFTESEDLMLSGRKMKVSASRRERCRINQARYRKRQRKYAEDLDESIRSLQEEIRDLETHRQNILQRAPTNENIWVVATEYFRLFRHGYMAPVLGWTDSSSSLTSRPEHESHTQLDFLKATMAQDVTDGIVCGAEALLENWKLVSQYCGDVNVQLKRLEQVTTDSLLATTKPSVTITENTLRQVFPHLVEGEGKVSPLGEKLLNQRLVLRGSVRFDWDVSMSRVIRHESTVDVLTSMLQLLGSLEDVAMVFGRALVTLEGKFLSKNSKMAVFN